MNIIFFGSDDFALTNFQALLNSGYPVRALVTQPDRPKGRGMKMEASAVKTCALQHKIPVLQPEKINDAGFVKQLADLAPDLFVVIAYGRILPPEILRVPKIGAVNVHGSLLPKYRGAAPINWAIINGEKETGISIIKMNAQMDAGDILIQARMKISDDETAQSLRSRMAELSAAELVKALPVIERGECKAVVQDASGVTLAPKLTKELGKIDWSKSAKDIHNLVRGLSPRPAAYTAWQGKGVKILETRLAASAGAAPGTITAADDDGITVAAGDGAVLITRVHPESSKPMTAKSFAAGYRLARGGRLE